MFVNILFRIMFFFKQKTAYEMRISDWSSDVCSSDLLSGALTQDVLPGQPGRFYGQCDAVKTKARPGKQFANSRKARPFRAKIDVGERVRHNFPVDRRSTDPRLNHSRFRRTQESIRASAPVTLYSRQRQPLNHKP